MENDVYVKNIGGQSFLVFAWQDKNLHY